MKLRVTSLIALIVIVAVQQLHLTRVKKNSNQVRGKDKSVLVAS
jgi:hypothetical protein